MKANLIVNLGLVIAIAAIVIGHLPHRTNAPAAPTPIHQVRLVTDANGKRPRFVNPPMGSLVDDELIIRR